MTRNLSPLTRRRFLESAAVLGTGAPWLASRALAQPNPVAGDPMDRKNPNLLFIMTDQQRFDALSRAGNRVLHTPNLDRLAREGAYFENAYTACPVCAPARAVILTGRGIYSNGVITNREAEDETCMTMPTFDNLLSDAGYRTEYYGKWHDPKTPTRTYDRILHLHTYPAYVRDQVPLRPLREGERQDTFTRRPYRMDPIDSCYGLAPDAKPVGPNGQPLRIIQPDLHGCLDIPDEHTCTAYFARETMAALRRTPDRPFSITCSLHHPHSPILPTKRYADLFPAEAMPLPASIEDPMTESPYRDNWGRGDAKYRDPELIRYMIANYYALVKEIDDYVGHILDTLDELGLAEDTLVIFTSDHGEMLGAHGMREKNIFYEESAHVPLLMRFPGRIRPGTVVREPVSQVDLFATILDYLEKPAQESEGRSLRPLVEGRSRGGEEFAVSEWPVYGGEGRFGTHFGPNFMLRAGEWKFIFAQTPESTAVNALYNLREDPLELTNLLGPSARTPETVERAEAMKQLLLTWLEQNRSPHLDGVRARAV